MNSCGKILIMRYYVYIKDFYQDIKHCRHLTICAHSLALVTAFLSLKYHPCWSLLGQFWPQKACYKGNWSRIVIWIDPRFLRSEWTLLNYGTTMQRRVWTTWDEPSDMNYPIGIMRDERGCWWRMELLFIVKTSDFFLYLSVHFCSFQFEEVRNTFVTNIHQIRHLSLYVLEIPFSCGIPCGP